MKNIKFVSIFIMAFVMFSITSCDNEPLEGEFSDGTQNGGGNGNGGSNSNISSIYDKWWYDSEDFTADVYFHSNGMYEQKIELLGNELVSTGDWFWENESDRIMKIENLEGTGQAASEAWFRFSNIESSSLNLEQSQNGTSYVAARLYRDTD